MFCFNHLEKVTFCFLVLFNLNLLHLSTSSPVFANIKEGRQTANLPILPHTNGGSQAVNLPHVFPTTIVPPTPGVNLVGSKNNFMNYKVNLPKLNMDFSVPESDDLSVSFTVNKDSNTGFNINVYENRFGRPGIPGFFSAGGAGPNRGSHTSINCQNVQCKPCERILPNDPECKCVPELDC